MAFVLPMRRPVPTNLWSVMAIRRCFAGTTLVLNHLPIVNAPLTYPSNVQMACVQCLTEAAMQTSPIVPAKHPLHVGIGLAPSRSNPVLAPHPFHSDVRVVDSALPTRPCALMCPNVRVTSRINAGMLSVLRRQMTVHVLQIYL